jgi:uncharacterized protein with GYD domain
MATYITLGTFTDQGMRTVQDTTKRAEAVAKLAKKHGVTMKEIYWTLGSVDMVVLFEAKDDASMTALGLTIGKAGNVRTQTLRAFTRGDMDAILKSVS